MGRAKESWQQQREEQKLVHPTPKQISLLRSKSFSTSTLPAPHCSPISRTFSAGSENPPSKKMALLERALSLSEKQHGSRVHPEVAVSLTNLGMAYGGASAARAAEGRMPEAQALLQQGLSTLQLALSIKTSLYSTRNPQRGSP